MPICHKCGRELREGSKFCTGCGAALTLETAFCSQCGAKISAGDVFCPECGATVGAQAQQPEKRGGPKVKLLPWVVAAVALVSLTALVLVLTRPATGEKEAEPAVISQIPNFAIPDVGKWLGAPESDIERDTYFLHQSAFSSPPELDAYFAYLELLENEYHFRLAEAPISYVINEKETWYYAAFHYEGEGEFEPGTQYNNDMESAIRFDLIVSCVYKADMHLGLFTNSFLEALVIDGGAWDGSPPTQTLTVRDIGNDSSGLDVSRLHRGKATAQPTQTKTVTVNIEVTAGGGTACGTLTTKAATLGEAMRDAGAIGGSKESWGFYVTEVYGITADESAGEYWTIDKNGQQLQTDIDKETLKDGDTYTFILNSASC